MVEYVGEDFYNQLAGKRMLATFDDQELKRLEVDGNVEAIFLPQESDSTYNRLVNAESSFLTIDMNGREMGRRSWGGARRAGRVLQPAADIPGVESARIALRKIRKIRKIGKIGEIGRIR